MKHRRPFSLRDLSHTRGTQDGPSAQPSRQPRATRGGKGRLGLTPATTLCLGGFVVLLLLHVSSSSSWPSGVQAAEAVVDVHEPPVVQDPQQLLETDAARNEQVPPPKQRKPLYGNLTYAIYRFPAQQLGADYLQAVAQFDNYIGDMVDPQGAAFAAVQTQRPRTRAYHDACFQRPDEDVLLQREQAKKAHSAQGKDRRDFLREEHALFYGPQVTINDTLITADAKWAWRTAAVYSAQYAGRQTEFRQAVGRVLHTPRNQNFFGGRVSGTFWYPPRAIREWHTNKWDVQVNPQTQQPDYVWRMYYIRQKAAAPDGGLLADDAVAEDYFVDKSGMHVVEGPGMTPERLEELGAYRLEDNGLWRIPDQNGYVSLFRLQVAPPYRWHCIVADETVHRYSMGISLDDQGVEAMLRHAGVEL